MHHSDGSVTMKVERVLNTKKSASSGKMYSEVKFEGWFPNNSGRCIFFHQEEKCPLEEGKEYRLEWNRKEHSESVFVKLWQEKKQKTWNKPNPTTQFKIEALKMAIELFKADKIKDSQVESMAKRLNKILTSNWE